MYPHRIRLHGPWRYQPMTRTVALPEGVAEEEGACPEAGRMKIPAAWHRRGLGDFRGRVRFSRSFHRPRTLEGHERLWLVFHGVDYFARVTVNDAEQGSHVGYFEPFAFDITPLLEARNEIVVEVDLPREADPRAKRLLRGEGRTGGGLCADVALEVRAQVELRDVRVAVEFIGGPSASASTQPSLHVSGIVCGEFSGNLHVDVSVGEQGLASQPVEADRTGRPFYLTAPVGHLARWEPWFRGNPAVHELRIDLHGAGRTLYGLTRTFGVCDLGRRVSNVERPEPLWLDALDPQFDAGFVSELRKRDVCWVRAPGRVLPSAVYEQLDRAGVLVWQDFPAFGGQADDEATRTEAALQARALVRLLGHHPCIALWCCHARPAGKPTALDEAIQGAIREEDAQRPCLLSDQEPGT